MLSIKVKEVVQVRMVLVVDAQQVAIVGVANHIQKCTDASCQNGKAAAVDQVHDQRYAQVRCVPMEVDGWMPVWSWRYLLS